MEHKVQFMDMDNNGNTTLTRMIKQSNIAKCPYVIFVPVHYRSDGTCRCDDISHAEMGEWGYTWVSGKWRAVPTEEEDF